MTYIIVSVRLCMCWGLCWVLERLDEISGEEVYLSSFGYPTRSELAGWHQRMSSTFVLCLAQASARTDSECRLSQ